MNVCLTTYATTPHFKRNQLLLNLTALRLGGLTELSPWDSRRLGREEFYRLHRDVLDCERGAGYWLWKPFIILQELIRLDDLDYVVYSDCGRVAMPLRRPIDRLLDWCGRNRGMLPGVYIPVYGANRRWTKRDCFVLAGCDHARYWNTCQLQASFSVWQKTPEALAFVRKWLNLCTDGRIITDSPNVCGLPNFADFVDHRHDQSVLTLCAMAEGVAGLGDPACPEPFCDNDKSIDSVLARLGVEPVAAGRSEALVAVVDRLWPLIALLDARKARTCSTWITLQILRWFGRPGSR